MSIREIGGRRVVTIPEGAGVLEISSILKAAGLVSDPLKFSFAARALGVANRLQAGAYEFGPEFSELEVLLSLRYGDIATRTVTVPEGYRAGQIATLLEGTIGIDADEFMSLVRDPLFIAELGVTAPTLEGFLHPDSYRFTLETPPRDVIRRMVQKTWDVYDEELQARAEKPRHVHARRHDARLDHRDRGGRGLRAEQDLGRVPQPPQEGHAPRGRPHRAVRDGQVRVRGFSTGTSTLTPRTTPTGTTDCLPGPICNPGAASVRAALFPLDGCNDLFFVSNGDGTHTFSRTYGEHQAARLRIAAEREAGQFPLDTDPDGE